jgi:SRSO17 transposase
MYISCSLSRNLDGELTTLVRDLVVERVAGISKYDAIIRSGFSKNRKISVCGVYSKHNFKTSETVVLKYGSRY